MIGWAAAPASAANYVFPGERDAWSNPVASRAARFGHDFWTKRGYRPCLGELKMAPVLEYAPGQFGNGVTNGCDIWFSVKVIELANTYQPFLLFNICTVGVHEEAHTAGLTHEQMDPYWEQVKAACGGWADWIRKNRAAWTVPPKGVRTV